MPLENYIIGVVIGKGSYGEVTLARHKKDKKQYVVKKIDFQNASPKERLYAKQEVDILSKLKHPNIVSYKESFQTDDGALSIVMGYCELGDLYTHLKNQSKLAEYLSETKIVEWFVQITMALQYLHNRQILHRDLKTQNIFLTKSKIIKIGDLGIARVLENNCDMATTMIGTPYYMSPELFSNKPYNHKSDVWALGCCLYEMATLKHAFNARDMNSLVYKILKGKTPEIPSNYSSELRSIIKSMLNYDPDSRPSAGKILRLPYIKRQIAIFLEGTKNRRRLKEKEPAKEKDIISSDSGFCEISNEDPQCATISEVKVDILNSDKDSKKNVNKPREKNENRKCSSDPASRDRGQGLRHNRPKKDTPSSVELEKDNPRKHSDAKVDSREEVRIRNSKSAPDIRNNKPSDVRKILSDRIQAKARLKRRESQEKPDRVENEEVHPEKICNGVISSNNDNSSENRRPQVSELKEIPEKSPNEPPCVPVNVGNKNVLPPFRCNVKDKQDIANLQNQNIDEEPKVSVGVPNLSARKKRRIRQQQSDSSLNSNPRYSNVKPDSFVSYQSYTPRPKEEIIKEHLSRASVNPVEKDSTDGCPSQSSTLTLSEDDDTLTPPDVSEKGSRDVSSLIDHLQATLTIAEKSRETVSPEATEALGDDGDSQSQYSPYRLKNRIEVLRKECLDGLGKDVLNQAFNIIDNNNDDSIEKSLHDLLGKSKFEEFAGPIWQLKFCEDF